MKSVRISSRITQELKQALERRADKDERSESQIVEKALRSYLTPSSKAQKDRADE